MTEHIKDGQQASSVSLLILYAFWDAMMRKKQPLLLVRV